MALDIDGSVRSGLWLQRQVREGVRQHAVEILTKTRGAAIAEELAAKIDAVSDRSQALPGRAVAAVGVARDAVCQGRTRRVSGSSGRSE